MKTWHLFAWGTAVRSAVKIDLPALRHKDCIEVRRCSPGEYDCGDMKILSWNVLHRVHAETHTEKAVERWPDEAQRVRAVAGWLMNALTAGDFDVALLQEVSGDVLAALRAQFSARSVLDHLYPRVPKRNSGSLRDPREHLVVIAPAGAKIVRTHTFENDPGKGFLMVQLASGPVVISTHLSWGPKAVPQLLLLSQVLRDAPGPVCLGGDFNADRDAVCRAIHEEAAISVFPEGSPCTRPRNSEGGGEDIDHLLCRGARLTEAHVLEHGGLSDHHPVGATLELTPVA